MPDRLAVATVEGRSNMSEPERPDEAGTVEADRCVHRSMGVEEEFLLVDPSTGHPLTCNLAVVEAAEKLGVRLQLEFTQCQVETTSLVCWHTHELRTQLAEMRAIGRASRSCRLATRLAPSGVIPAIRCRVCSMICSVASSRLDRSWTARASRPRRRPRRLTVKLVGHLLPRTPRTFVRLPTPTGDICQTELLGRQLIHINGMQIRMPDNRRIHLHRQQEIVEFALPELEPCPRRRGESTPIAGINKGFQ